MIPGIIASVRTAVAGPTFHAYGADTDGWIRGIVTGDGSLTFARSSTATVVDWEGLVKTVLANELRIKNSRRVENLLSETDDLTHADWATNNVNVSGSRTDPDGGSTAYRLTATGSGYWRQTFAGIIDRRSSIWVKRITGTGTVSLYNGRGTINTDITSVITTSWQRLATIVGTGFATNNRIGVVIATSGDEVDVWHPQFELVEGQTNQNPSEYVSVGVESGDYHGVGVDGVAYFEYENGNTVASNVVTEAKGADLTTDWGALYEPLATNLLLYSSEFPNAQWTSDGATRDSDVAAGPTGELAADRLNVATDLGKHEIFQSKSSSANTLHTASCYIKDDGAGYGGVSLYAASTGFFTVVIDLSNGSVTDTDVGVNTTSTSSRIEALDNGWYRVNCTAIVDGTSTSLFCIPFASESGTPTFNNGRPVYTGTEGKDILLWGAQLATGSSSYIPTTTVAVTRTADDGDGAFAYSNWNQTQGTLIFDLVMEEETNQGIFNVANAEAGVVSYDTTNKFQADDGTNQANVDPTLSSNLGDVIRIAVDYATSGSLFIGYKNVTDAGSWVWDTDSASYDGAFATNSVINIFYDGAGPSRIKDLYYYSSEKGKAFVEANY